MANFLKLFLKTLDLLESSTGPEPRLGRVFLRLGSRIARRPFCGRDPPPKKHPGLHEANRGSLGRGYFFYVLGSGSWRGFVSKFSGEKKKKSQITNSGLEAHDGGFGQNRPRRFPHWLSALAFRTGFPYWLSVLAAP